MEGDEESNRSSEYEEKEIEIDCVALGVPSIMCHDRESVSKMPRKNKNKGRWLAVANTDDW